MNFPDLKSVHFAIIMATYEVANLITSLILGKFLARIKRKNMIIIAYFFLAIGTFGFVPLNRLQTD